MDKLLEVNSEDDIEEWIKVFECRAACSKVKDDKTRIQWCRSVDRRIIKGLPDGAQWGQVEAELRKYLGEDNSESAAWKRLRGYKAKGKCFGKIASEVKELAEKAADEDDVRERLAVEAFLGAIPWHFAREIKMKRIDSLKEALEEAKLCRTLEEEEDGRKRVQAVTEDLRSARQEEGQRTKEARKGRRGPVCWGCGKPGHVLKNCELFKEFKGQPKRGKQKAGEVKVKSQLDFERGPLGTCVAPAQTLTSSVIFQEVVVAGVPVRALVGSGATTSCCSR